MAAASASLPGGPLRCSAMTSRIHPGKSSVGRGRPRIHDSSRWVCALTRPGSNATSPRSISLDAGKSLGRDGPNATMRSLSVKIQPSRMGGCEIGRSHAALYCAIELRWSVRPPLFLRAASGRVAAELLRHAGISISPCGGEAQHARDLARPEDRVTQNLVVHVPPLRDEAGVFDVAYNLDFIHAVRGTGGTHHVLLDHD